MSITPEELATIKAANFQKSRDWEAATFVPGDVVLSHGHKAKRLESAMWEDCTTHKQYETLSRWGRDCLKRSTSKTKEMFLYLEENGAYYAVNTGTLPVAAERDPKLFPEGYMALAPVTTTAPAPAPAPVTTTTPAPEPFSTRSPAELELNKTYRFTRDANGYSYKMTLKGTRTEPVWWQDCQYMQIGPSHPRSTVWEFDVEYPNGSKSSQWVWEKTYDYKEHGVVLEKSDGVWTEVE